MTTIVAEIDRRYSRSLVEMRSPTDDSAHTHTVVIFTYGVTGEKNERPKNVPYLFYTFNRTTNARRIRPKNND